MAYRVESWHDFFLMLGGASAALAGLVLVGLSIHAEAVAADPLHRLRGRDLTAGILYVGSCALSALAGASLIAGTGGGSTCCCPPGSPA